MVNKLFTIGKYKEKNLKKMQINKIKSGIEYNYFEKMSIEYKFIKICAHLLLLFARFVIVKYELI